MAKRPLYPVDVTRKYTELPDDYPSRTTDEKLEAADALQEHWQDDQSFKAIADRISVKPTTVGRAFWQFFGPTDEDYTFRELGEKYKDPDDENADWSDGLDDYLRARKHERLNEFKNARTSRQRQEADDEVPTPLSPRELEIARYYYERGANDLRNKLGIDEDDVPDMAPPS